MVTCYISKISMTSYAMIRNCYIPLLKQILKNCFISNQEKKKSSLKKTNKQNKETALTYLKSKTDHILSSKSFHTTNLSLHQPSPPPPKFWLFFNRGSPLFKKPVVSNGLPRRIFFFTCKLETWNFMW